MCTKGSGTNSEMPPVRFCAQEGQTSQALLYAIFYSAAIRLAVSKHWLLWSFIPKPKYARPAMRPPAQQACLQVAQRRQVARPVRRTVAVAKHDGRGGAQPNCKCATPANRAAQAGSRG